MRKIALDVETLRCEANEEEVLDELLAQEGVLAAEIDLANERVAFAFDERVTSKMAVIDHLRFYGLAVRREAIARNA